MFFFFIANVGPTSSAGLTIDRGISSCSRPCGRSVITNFGAQQIEVKRMPLLHITTPAKPASNALCVRTRNMNRKAVSSNEDDQEAEQCCDTTLRTHVRVGFLAQSPVIFPNGSRNARATDDDCQCEEDYHKIGDQRDRICFPNCSNLLMTRPSRKA